MARDCFGNATPYPPGIADTAHDIQRFAHIPFRVRYAYLSARSDAMIGAGTPERAWELYWDLLKR